MTVAAGAEGGGGGGVGLCPSLTVDSVHPQPVVNLAMMRELLGSIWAAKGGEWGAVAAIGE